VLLLLAHWRCCSSSSRRAAAAAAAAAPIIAGCAVTGGSRAGSGAAGRCWPAHQDVVDARAVVVLSRACCCAPARVGLPPACMRGQPGALSGAAAALLAARRHAPLHTARDCCRGNDGARTAMPLQRAASARTCVGGSA
jgi:hypothetical protein